MVPGGKFICKQLRRLQISLHKSENSINNEDYIQQYKNEATKYVHLHNTSKHIFSTMEKGCFSQVNSQAFATLCCSLYKVSHL